MLKPQFDGELLVLRPDGPITREDVAALTRAVDEHLASRAKLAGAMIETPAFPGYADPMAFADHMRFVATHYGRVRRIALVTDSPLAAVAETIAGHIASLELRHYKFGDSEAALTWLRSP
jgi:hypothetical protein